MTVREVILSICEDEVTNLKDIADYNGMNQGNLSHLIAHSHNDGMDMKVSTLLKLLEPLAAELIVKDADGAEYLIEAE